MFASFIEHMSDTDSKKPPSPVMRMTRLFGCDIATPMAFPRPDPIAPHFPSVMKWTFAVDLKVRKDAAKGCPVPTSVTMKTVFLVESMMGWRFE